ncbi:MAG TPA: hypothetical protein VFQ36_20470, partial [Ktedonobacteraceae bacterium]|nr:hypothetical protein [Ktedonobacteraceae bacterium]
ISLRVLSFEHMYCLLDPTNSQPSIKTFAQTLKTKFQIALQTRLEQEGEPHIPVGNDGLAESDAEAGSESVDTLTEYKKKAIKAFCDNHEFIEKIRMRGMPWGVIGGFLKEVLPDTLEDRRDIAFGLVIEALEKAFGPENEAWHTDRLPTGGKLMVWVMMGKPA